MPPPDHHGAPLSVALLSPCYWPEVRRGTERFVRELATGLLERGHAPRLITSHPGLPRAATEDGLPVLRLPRPPQKPLERLGFESYLTHPPLSYGALAARRFDVVHAMYPTDALAAAWWKRRTRRPAILSYMGIPERPWLLARRGRLKVLKRALRGCDVVVALSQHAAEVFSDVLAYDARVIPPGVDLATFAAWGSRAAAPTIICPADAGEPRKNVSLLVEAFTILRRDHPDARLVLSRPKDMRVAQAAAAPPGSAGIEWRDLDSRQALARAYSEAWVCALPSAGEAFGLVLAEAMACGTPVVGYAHGAIPELIDRPEIGRTFDRLDAAALAAALHDALGLAELPATAKTCRARAAEFSTDRTTERYVELYRELGA